MAFMRMRSPSKAPPVFRLEGSTEMMATRRSSKSRINRRTSSSTSEDLPAPPVVSMSTADSFACYGTDITMKANVLNGKPNYSYKWDRYTYDYDTTKQTITVKNPTFVAGDTFQSLKFKFGTLF